MNIQLIIIIFISLVLIISIYIFLNKIKNLESNLKNNDILDKQHYEYLQKLVNDAVFKFNSFDPTKAVQPIGTIITYAGMNIPLKYKICDGSKLLIAEYTDLFKIIGKSFNDSKTDSTLYFNLPDLRDQFSSLSYKKSWLRAEQRGVVTQSANKYLICNTVISSNGTNIQYNPATGIITLNPNITYKLEASPSYVACSNLTQELNVMYSWFNITDNIFFGSSTQYLITNPSNSIDTGTAFIKPTKQIQVGFYCTYSTPINNTTYSEVYSNDAARRLAWINVEQISLETENISKPNDTVINYIIKASI